MVTHSNPELAEFQQSLDDAYATVVARTPQRRHAIIARYWSRLVDVGACIDKYFPRMGLASVPELTQRVALGPTPMQLNVVGEQVTIWPLRFSANPKTARCNHE